jgi:formyltetrahydrofolate deformylase
VSSTATLLVSCQDRKGIVAALAQTLYAHGANILDADQHTDPVAGTFFQRIRFDRSQLTTDADALERSIGEIAGRFSMQWRLADASARKRIAIFVSKYDHCLFDLLLRHRAGELACDIVAVVGNHEVVSSVATQFDVPFHHVPIRPDTKADQEKHQLALLRDLSVDVVVLARYMQILSRELLEAFAGSVINIHHSFLPAFMGSRPYQRAYERGVKLIGATAHYATVDLDEGPIIEQDVVRCSHRDSIEELIRKGRDLEKAVLARAVRWHLDDRVLVYDNKTVVFD